MEAAYINMEFTSQMSFNEAAEIFFKDYSTQSVQVLLWKFFQCWATRDCKLISDLSDEEVALFFDQLVLRDKPGDGSGCARPASKDGLPD